MKNAFTIRVYGIINNDSKLLISKEKIQGVYYNKLPGGGLEYGEGTLDCLIRELKEEIGIDVSKNYLEHFYTTDFFQPSIFNKEIQVISIYYKVTLPQNIIKQINNIIALRSFPVNQIQLEWKELNENLEEYMSLPIDKIIVNQLIKKG